MTMATLLDEFNHDVYMDPVTHRLARTTDLSAIVAQRIKCRLLTVRGEWGQAPEIGVPLFDKVLGGDNKAPDLVALKHLFATEIAKVEDVYRLDSLVLAFNNAGRSLSINFAATCVDASVARGSI